MNYATPRCLKFLLVEDVRRGCWDGLFLLISSQVSAGFGSNVTTKSSDEKLRAVVCHLVVVKSSGNMTGFKVLCLYYYSLKDEDIKPLVKQ